MSQRPPTERDQLHRKDHGIAASCRIPSCCFAIRLTFNGHRIHYDRTYVFAVEGYPGLIVHGPLIATLLIDLVRRSLPSSVVVKAYSFRAVSPLFDGSELHLNGSPPDETGKILLWATNDRDELIMKAEATI